MNKEGSAVHCLDAMLLKAGRKYRRKWHSRHVSMAMQNDTAIGARQGPGSQGAVPEEPSDAVGLARVRVSRRLGQLARCHCSSGTLAWPSRG